MRIILLLLVLIPAFSFAQKKEVIGKNDGVGTSANISVLIEDDNRRPLVGANIYVVENEQGYVTDEKGKVIINLERRIWTARISYIGFETQEIILDVRGSGRLKISMKEQLQTLDEVIVSSRAADENVKSTDLGRQVMSIQTIESLPPFVGEVDVLKSITLLPGVTTVGEASSGFNIRGSSSDQNLILLGGATLYNPSHLFGFFSAFNADLIQDVTVLKGGIPAKYGGRAASIIDLQFKRGNPDVWTGKGSLGMISAKISAGGPLIENKLTLLVGGRASYSNWLLSSINNAEIRNSNAQFYDANVLLDYDISDKTILQYRFYRSSDDFSFASDTSFAWANQSHVVELGHTLSDKLYVNVQAALSQYNFTIQDKIAFTGFDLTSKINDRNAQIGFTYNLNDRNEIQFGAQNKWLEIEPGDLQKRSDESSIIPKTVRPEYATETGFYVQHDLEVGSLLGLSYGIRYNKYRFLGPNNVATYEENLPKSDVTIVDQTDFGDGDLIQSYDGFEPRFGLRLSLGESASIKLGYNQMYQYIHLVSNTTTIAPTDTWKLSDPFIKPQKVVQYSGGIFKNFGNNKIETSIEVFYKELDNVLDYKDGAELILNDNLEAELLNGTGRSYGIEAYIQKRTGKFTGWVSYTWSRSERKVIGAYPEETINGGEWYPAFFDVPSSLSIVGEYKISPNLKFSSIFSFNSGRPVTYPAAKFIYNGQDIAFYDERNNFRAPNYHRLDVSLTMNFNSNKKLLQGDWVLSVFNIYSRKNAFSVFFDDLIGNPPQAYRLAVLGVAFPSLSYNFEF